MDASLSGVAVATSTPVATGTPVVVGRTQGRVVRQLEGGFAVEFSRIQNPDTLERDLIHHALVKANGNKTAAARLLGITRRRLYSRLESISRAESDDESSES